MHLPRCRAFLTRASRHSPRRHLAGGCPRHCPSRDGGGVRATRVCASARRRADRASGDSRIAPRRRRRPSGDASRGPSFRSGFSDPPRPRKGVVSETRGDAMPPPFGDYARRRYTRETLERMTLTDTVPCRPSRARTRTNPRVDPGSAARSVAPSRHGLFRAGSTIGATRAVARSPTRTSWSATSRRTGPRCRTRVRRATGASPPSPRSPRAARPPARPRRRPPRHPPQPRRPRRGILDGDADGFSCATCGRRFLDATAFVKHKMAHGRAEREEATRALRETANRGERNAYPARRVLTRTPSDDAP